MKVLTVGGAMIDTIAVIDGDLIERMAMRNAETAYLLLEEGRKVEALDISTHCGGGAVNTAVAFARLGHDVSAMIRLGQDQRADVILDKLEAEGVSTRFAMREPRQPTGASVHVAAHDRNAAIFTFRGANTLLEAKDLKKDAFAVDLVYVSSLSNQSADCFPAIIKQAKANSAMVATNPGIRQLSARAGAFQESLAGIDVLSLNRVEAATLVPWLVGRFGEGGATLAARPGEALPDLLKQGLAGGGFELSLPGFCTALHGLGPKWIVITDGKNGAYVSAPSQLIHCPVIQMKAAGTAGAGDAFSATFTAFVAEGLPAEDAAIAAALNAASVIAIIDTQSGLLTRKAIDSRLPELKQTHKLQHWTI